MTDQSGRLRQDLSATAPRTSHPDARRSEFVIAGVLTAIPAWVMGSGDLKKMDAGIMDPQGGALTMAGRILGMVCTILTIVILAIALLAIAFHATTEIATDFQILRVGVINFTVNNFIF